MDVFYIMFLAAAIIVSVVSAAATSVQRPPWLWNIVGVGLFFILPWPSSSFWRVVASIVVVFAIMLIDKAIEQWRESVKRDDPKGTAPSGEGNDDDGS